MMTPKMVANFRRSLSFQNHPSSSTSKLPRKILHVRSTSLPACRSYPLISHLKDTIRNLKTSWYSSDLSKLETQLTSATLCDGLSQLNSIHDSLHDLLHLPQTRESLRLNPEWVEKILEDYLGFIDIYGTFQSVVLALKQEVSAARLAVRRKDDSKARVYFKALKKTAKGTCKLVSATRSIGQNPVPGSDVLEICEVIKDVMEVTIMVSGCLFGGISTSFVSRKTWWVQLQGLKYSRKVTVEEGIQELQLLGTVRLWGLSLRREKDEEVKRMLKKMNEMEICLSGIECGSQKMFRSLINTRVSLLNLLTQ